jgi:hypothetical protein
MNRTLQLPAHPKQLLLLVFLVASACAFAQEKRTISGYVSDDKTGERLIGATVYDTVHRLGAVANEYGFYSITVPNEVVVLKISAYGLTPKWLQVPLGTETVDVALATATDLEEVVVNARDAQRSVESTNSGTIELQMDKIDKLPVLLGEKDVIKIVQLLPGVKSGGEGSSGLYVRGGGPDQNLILLDGVPVYNASHLFGFFSVFNSDALSQVTLIKGGFPARYGGRISSVLDMRMKEGNTKRYNIEGSVGLIASRILVEGPIRNGKTAFAFSARRTYIDVLSQPFQQKDNRGGYFFYDMNAKVHHKINDKHHLYLSGYFGKDKAYFKSDNEYSNGPSHTESHSESQLKWGNAIGALRWNWRIAPKLFANTTLTWSQYQFKIGYSGEDKTTENGDTETESYGFSYISGINDWSGKMDFTFIPNPDNNVKFGVGDTYHTFRPGVNRFEQSGQGSNQDTSFGSYDQYAHELFAYIENDQVLTPRLKINYGLHLSAFLVSGKEYVQLQPRFSGNFILNEYSSLKMAYARTAQYLHLLSNTGIGLPTDLWVPATASVKPVIADQVSAGYNREFLKQYNAVLEVYYKKMNNIIQYKEGAGFLGDATDWQSKVEAGEGWSYGAELFIEKRKGRFSGWAGYTLSWAERRFDGINGGEKFFYRYDRRHDVSIVFTYDINEQWNCGVVFVYGTGNAVTLPTQYFNVAPNPVTNMFGMGTVGYFDEVNDYRMPAYHRMDVGINRTKKVRWGETVLSLSVYNVYNRRNPFYIYTESTNNGASRLMQVSLFPIIPSISWKFKVDFDAVNKQKELKKQ